MDNSHWHYWGIFLLSLVALLLSPNTSYTESIAGIRARGLLRVGVSGDYRPFSYCSEDVTGCEGLDIEIASRLAKDLGVSFTLVRFRWPELLTDLNAGKFDIAMSGVTIRPERVLRATFTRPYTVARAVVLVADAQRFPSLSTVDQPDVRIAVNAGGHLEQVARTRFHSATIVPIAKNLSLPDVVKERQAEALLTDSLEAPHFLATHPTLHPLPAFGRDRKAYMLRRVDSDVRAWLDQWLLAREADEVLDNLRTRWLGKDSLATPHQLAALFALLDARLAVMPAVADYKRRHNLPIEDRQQEQIVMDGVAIQAQDLGINATGVRAAFRSQIELAKQVQQVVLQTPADRSLLPLWAQGLDLNNDLRPALGELNDRIMRELARVAPLLHDRTLLQRLTEEEVTVSGVSPDGKRQLSEALSAVGR